MVRIKRRKGSMKYQTLSAVSMYAGHGSGKN